MQFDEYIGDGMGGTMSGGGRGLLSRPQPHSQAKAAKPIPEPTPCSMAEAESSVTL